MAGRVENLTKAILFSGATTVFGRIVFPFSDLIFVFGVFRDTFSSQDFFHFFPEPADRVMFTFFPMLP